MHRFTFILFLLLVGCGAPSETGAFRNLGPTETAQETAETGLECTGWYTDMDDDGYGDPATEQVLCGDQSGLVMDGSDCNDADPAIFPGALELCDGIDQDCNGVYDDGLEQNIYYRDFDADGFGAASSGTVEACSNPDGYVANGNDCDDNSRRCYPGNMEIEGDGLDNDCDGEIL